MEEGFSRLSDNKEFLRNLQMMSEPVFCSDGVDLQNFPPSIERLQWFVKGSLQQNLLRAVRLWSLVHFLYGEARSDKTLDNRFTFADWRHAFFSTTHPQDEKKPKFHDANCACAKTTADWLFYGQINGAEREWRQTFQQYSRCSDQELNQLLQSQPFAVTRRSLQADLQILTEFGWLQRQGQDYIRVMQLPIYPVSEEKEPGRKFNTHPLNFLTPDIAALVQNFPQEIQGVQRFFLHVDYIVSQDVVDQVEDWQEKLCQIWTDKTVPPIRLSYVSSRLGRSLQCIVYPVCVYYAQRAVYLCAFGQTPTREGEWYNYRLDRIRKLTPMQWTDPKVPQLLLNRYQKGSLPTPEYIEVEMAKAWGFDFYLSVQPMLIRFNREFHDGYIAGTFRHDTFTAISYKGAERFIEQQTPCSSQRQTLLEILHARSPQDAYYRVNYRVGDTNIGQRLRAWRPNGEILLPWDLRQAIAAEVRQEFQFYHNQGMG